MSKKYALLFPGQGSQVVGMGSDFYQTYKECALVFEEASDAIHLNLKKICFSGSIEELTSTSILQPALFTVEVAIFTALKKRVELTPLFAAGHSLGEYTALFSAGSLSIASGAKLTSLRGQAMQAASDQMLKDFADKNQGSSALVNLAPMCAVLGAENKVVEKLCSKAAAETKLPLSIANYNAPGQIVIAGHPLAIARATELAKADSEFGGAKTIPLQVSAPFHCSLMKSAETALSQALEEVAFSTPAFPVLSNVTAHPVTEAIHFAGLLTSQVTSAVRWDESMRTGRQMGMEIALELGPGKVLAGLQKRIDKAVQCFNVFSVETFEKILTEVFPS